jgi:hypothetical protein
MGQSLVWGVGGKLRGVVCVLNDWRQWAAKARNYQQLLGFLRILGTAKREARAQDGEDAGAEPGGHPLEIELKEWK